MIIVPPPVAEPDQTVWTPGKLMQPELLIPGRKPVGEVEIDWANPLAKGLILCMPLKVDGSWRQDLSKQSVISYDGAGVDSPPDPIGGTMYFDDNGSGSGSNDRFKINQDMVLRDGQRTFLTSLKIDAASSNYNYVLGSTYATRTFSRTSASNDLNINLYAKGNHGWHDHSGRVWNLDQKYQLGYTADFINNDAKTIVDGDLFSMTKNGAGFTSTNWDSATDADTHFGRHGNANWHTYYGLNAFVDYVYMWDRILSSDEVASIYRNPYQFLKPKAKPIMATNARDDNSHAMLPDARLLAPDMLIPGRQPIGEVELDKTHWTADSLFFANVPRVGLYDIVSGARADAISAKSHLSGNFYQQNELSTLDPTRWDIAWPYASLGGSDDASYTMMWRVRIENAGITTAAYFFDWGPTELALIRYTDTIRIQWAGAPQYTITGVADGDIYDIAMTRDASTNAVKHYVNGVLVKTISTIGYTTFNAANAIYYHNEADQRGEGIEYFYCWVDRCLNETQIEKVRKSPYQILKPKAKAPVIIQPPHQAKAGFHVPDSRLEMPSLLIPGRKPVGEVAVDWEHKWGQHCIRAFVPARGVALDLLDGILTPASNAYVSGEGFAEFDGFNDKYTYSDSTPVENEITILCKVRRHTKTVNDGIYSDKDASVWATLQGISLNFRPETSSAMLFYVGAAVIYTTTGSHSTLGKFATVTASWKASTTQAIYVNDVEEAYASHTIASSYTKSTVATRLGTYYDGSSSRTLTGGIEYLFVLNKCLTQAEQAAFHRDPYQFLIPA